MEPASRGTIQVGLLVGGLHKPASFQVHDARGCLLRRQQTRSGLRVGPKNAKLSTRASPFVVVLLQLGFCLFVVDVTELSTRSDKGSGVSGRRAPRGMGWAVTMADGFETGREAGWTTADNTHSRGLERRPVRDPM